MFAITKRLHALKHHFIVKKVPLSKTMLLFAFVSSLLLFASINGMYTAYGQNIGPAQETQSNNQSRPLSNYLPISPFNNNGGNFSAPPN